MQVEAPLNFRIRPEFRAAIQLAARQRRMSLSAFIRAALAREIDEARAGEPANPIGRN